MKFWEKISGFFTSKKELLDERDNYRIVLMQQYKRKKLLEQKVSVLEAKIEELSELLHSRIEYTHRLEKELFEPETGAIGLIVENDKEKNDGGVKNCKYCNE